MQIYSTRSPMIKTTLSLSYKKHEKLTTSFVSDFFQNLFFENFPNLFLNFKNSSSVSYNFEKSAINLSEFSNFSKTTCDIHCKRI